MRVFTCRERLEVLGERGELAPLRSCNMCYRGYLKRDD